MRYVLEFTKSATREFRDLNKLATQMGLKERNSVEAGLPALYFP
jgi:hypothetical protein